MTLYLLDGLKRKGHEVFCVTSTWGSVDFKLRLNQLSVPFAALRLGFISKTISISALMMTLDQLIRLPALFIKFRRLLEKQRPDVVVHTNFHHLFVLYYCLPSCRNVYWSHEFVGVTRFYKRLFMHFSKKISLFIGVSKAVSDSIIGILGDQSVVTVKNGMPSPINSIEIEKGKSSGVLGIVGQISPHKGHELLFEALAILAKTNRDICLRIVGVGKLDYIQRLKSLGARLDISDLLDWRGFTADQDSIYIGVDMVIVPSIQPDPYPTVVMEAGFRGIPVIASDIGGLPEMIVEGYNGFLFKAGDSISLSQTIEKNLSLNNKIRSQALDFAVKNFGVENFIDAFEDSIL